MPDANPAIRFHTFCIWCGIAFATLFFVALIALGFFPPPSPLLTAEELMAHIAENHFSVRLGIPIGFLAAMLCIPWSVLISAHLWRIETADGGMPIMALFSIFAGAGQIIMYMWNFMFWAGMFYRLDADPGVIQVLFDITWLQVVMPFTTASGQMIAIGLGGFVDKSENPVFPRWCCYVNLWVAFLTMGGAIAMFFFKGPFAWNGIIAFWVPAVAFGVWINTMFFCMRKYVKSHS